MKHSLSMKLLLVLSIAPHTFAQGTFQNLSFEDATNVPTVSYGNMSPSDALPGWSCYIGTSQASYVGYNFINLDNPGIDLLSVDSTSPITESYDPPSDMAVGQYYLCLQYGWERIGASIAQTAQLPANTQSIQFRGTDALTVSFNGTIIPLIVLSSQNDYNTYGGNISQFAGQDGTLTIATIVSSSNWTYLDDIQFSTQSVPEPNGLALFAAVFGVLYYRSRRLK